jgi:sugar lactone lactonase YvrE
MRRALLFALAIPGAAQSLQFPSGIAFDRAGNLVVADRAANYVFGVNVRTGALSVIAGNGTRGFSGDGGPATQASFAAPEWIAIDKDQNVFVGDRANHRIRRIDGRSRVVTTVAGTGAAGFAGDGGPALQAQITSPYGLHFDGEGNMIVFDTDVDRIRMIDARTHMVRTIIGTGERGFSGDGAGPQIQVRRPHNGVVDHDGNLIFGDSFNQRIRMWDRRTGQVRTLAGKGQDGDPADGTPAMEAPFTYFGGMALDRNNDLIFSGLNNRIHRLDRKANKVYVIAGTGVSGLEGDDGPALKAKMATPYGLALATNGDIYFADAGNKRIRAIDMRTGTIRTVTK